MTSLETIQCKGAAIVLSGLFSAGAVLLIIFGSLSVDSVRMLAVFFTIEEFHFSYSEARHISMAGRAWNVGAGFGLIAVLILLFRRRMDIVFIQFAADGRDFIGSCRESLRATFLRISKLEAILLLSCIAVGAGLRFHFLGAPLAYDEGNAFQMSQQPFYLMLTNQSAAYHSLAVVSAGIFTRIFGTAEWVIRAPMLIAGLALLPVVYWVSRILFSRAVGIVATAIVAVAWPLVAYSVNARGYAFGNLAFVIMLGMVPYLVRTRNWAAIVAFASLSAIAGYSVQSMAFGYTVAFTFLAFSMLDRDGYRIVPRMIEMGVATSILTIGILILLFSPFLLAHGFSLLTVESEPLSGAPAMSMAGIIVDQLEKLYAQSMIDIPGGIQAILSAGLVTGMLFDRRGAILVAAALVGVAPMLFLVGVQLPPARIWQFLIPPLAMVTGRGLTIWVQALGQHKILHGVAGAAVVAGAVSVGFNAVKSGSVLYELIGRKSNWKLVDFSFEFANRVERGDVIVGKFAYRPILNYYLRQSLSKRGLRLVQRVTPTTDVIGRVCEVALPCPEKSNARRIYFDGDEKFTISVLRRYGIIHDPVIPKIAVMRSPIWDRHILYCWGCGRS